LVTGLVEFWDVFKAEGIAWRDRTVPSLGLHQVFIEDPSGVTIELNFPASEIDAVGSYASHASATVGEQP